MFSRKWIGKPYCTEAPQGAEERGILSPSQRESAESISCALFYSFPLAFCWLFMFDSSLKGAEDARGESTKGETSVRSYSHDH